MDGTVDTAAGAHTVARMLVHTDAAAVHVEAVVHSTAVVRTAVVRVEPGSQGIGESCRMGKQAAAHGI
jgi:CTP:molybdopterin cytidylyltransferase MocA